MNQADALVLANNQTFDQLDKRSAAILASIWARLPDYSNRGVEQFLREFVPYLIATQSAIAALTDAYLTSVISSQLGTTVLPVGVPAPEIAVGPAVRNGTPLDVEYTRPFETIWFELSQGVDYDTAVRHGLERAQTLAKTDLQLAKTNTARYVLERVGPRYGVIGYQRVITSPKACELCRIASTQRYHRQDLLPIHMNCTCGISPLYGDESRLARTRANQVIDTGFVHPEAESLGVNKNSVPVFDAHFINSGPTTQVAVRQHGEIGPVLTVADQHFRGPSDIPPTAETAA